MSVPTDYDDLLQRGVVTARQAPSRDPDDLAARLLELADWDRDRFAAVLSRALFALAAPGHVGDLDGIAADLAEAMYDAAHEGCDDETGCAGGGRPYYDEYVKGVLMPVVRTHAVPSSALVA